MEVSDAYHTVQPATVGDLGSSAIQLQVPSICLQRADYATGHTNWAVVLNRQQSKWQFRV